MSDELVFSGAVEGVLDEAILRRLIHLAGGRPGPIHGRNGKPHLQRSIGGYNNAARFSPWIVLLDLDHDADCAPAVLHHWLPAPARWMAFRVVVRKVESWLLADRDRLAAFLAVRPGSIPNRPEDLTDPKQVMVDLARQSRKRQIRYDMVPRPGSGRAVGPAYTSRLVEFTLDRDRGWRPQVAADSCASLARCIRRIVELGGQWAASLR